MTTPAVSNLRHIDSCITQLKAQGPSRTCNESKEEALVQTHTASTPGITCTGDSNSRGARPVRLIITMIEWIRTSRLSIKNSLSVVSQSALSSLQLSDTKVYEP